MELNHLPQVSAFLSEVFFVVVALRACYQLFESRNSVQVNILLTSDFVEGAFLALVPQNYR